MGMYLVRYIRKATKRVQSNRVEATIKGDGEWVIPNEKWDLHSSRDSCRLVQEQHDNFREYDFNLLERNVTEVVDKFGLTFLEFRHSFCFESLVMCLFTTGLGHLNLSILLRETTSIMLLGKYLVKKRPVTLFIRHPGTVKLCRSLNNFAHEGEFWAFLAGFVFSI